jgi:hypothetical protein
MGDAVADDAVQEAALKHCGALNAIATIRTDTA